VVRFEDIADFLGGCATAGPASEEVISSAEERLGVRFPPSYRRFLAQYGAALCSGFEIAGLFIPKDDKDAPPLWSDVVVSTLQRRRVARLLPRGHVAISDDGGDYTFYLDTARNGLGEECPVVALGPGVDGVVVAEDFPDFVERCFEGRIRF
jgi:hypothetical protein